MCRHLLAAPRQLWQQCAVKVCGRAARDGHTAGEGEGQGAPDRALSGEETYDELAMINYSFIFIKKVIKYRLTSF